MLGYVSWLLICYVILCDVMCCFVLICYHAKLVHIIIRAAARGRRIYKDYKARVHTTLHIQSLTFPGGMSYLPLHRHVCLQDRAGTRAGQQGDSREAALLRDDQQQHEEEGQAQPRPALLPVSGVPARTHCWRQLPGGLTRLRTHHSQGTSCLCCFCSPIPLPESSINKIIFLPTPNQCQAA